MRSDLTDAAEAEETLHVILGFAKRDILGQGIDRKCALMRPCGRTGGVHLFHEQ
jgi:hypothetical protein